MTPSSAGCSSSVVAAAGVASGSVPAHGASESHRPCGGERPARIHLCRPSLRRRLGGVQGTPRRD